MDGFGTVYIRGNLLEALPLDFAISTSRVEKSLNQDGPLITL
jgi:hypothetical protein